MYVSSEKTHDNTDMSYRKFTDNAVYNLASSMIGLPLGYPINTYEKKKPEDLLVRKYSSYKIGSRYSFIYNDAVCTWFPYSLERELTHWSMKNLSMLDNFMVNSTIEYSDYMYRCELNLDGTYTLRLHEFLFPVYIDVSKQHGAAFNTLEFPRILNGVEMEVSFGRKLPKTLSEFKYNRFFLNERTHVNQNIDETSGVNNMSIRGFDFYKTDTANFVGEMTRFSRVRKSRGNHTYKHKITFYNSTDTFAYGTLMNKLGSGPLSPSYTHADMIYGCQRAMIASIPERDEDIMRGYSHDEVYAHPHYLMNTTVPNYPTLYVDFVKPQSIKNQSSLPIFKDDMFCVGFIRLRLWSCPNHEINSGHIQYRYNNGVLSDRHSHSVVREMTNSEAFTVKFRFQKRRPVAMYTRNTDTAEEVYMLPPQLFGATINSDTNISVLVNDVARLYSYKDMSNLHTGQHSRAWYSGNELVFADLGGWLFPPTRLSQFTHAEPSQYMLDEYNYTSRNDYPRFIDTVFHSPTFRNLRDILDSGWGM